MAQDRFISEFLVEEVSFVAPAQVTVIGMDAAKGEHLHLVFTDVREFRIDAAPTDRSFVLLDVRLLDITAWQREGVRVRFADETPGDFVVEAGSVEEITKNKSD
jgi:hypothetical protein